MQDTVSIFLKNLQQEELKQYLTLIASTYPYMQLEDVNIEEYASKICKYAYMLVACKGNSEIVGLSLFYANDFSEKKAYLTHISVVEKYLDNGIGERLLKETEIFCKNKGMEKLVLQMHKDNKRAMKLYKKMGYEELNITKKMNLCYMEKKFILE